jgi:hypothetical protein
MEKAETLGVGCPRCKFEEKSEGNIEELGIVVEVKEVMDMGNIV